MISYDKFFFSVLLTFPQKKLLATGWVYSFI